MLDMLIKLNIIKKYVSSQDLFHKKYLVKMFLVFIRLNQF